MSPGEVRAPRSAADPLLVGALLAGLLAGWPEPAHGQGRLTLAPWEGEVSATIEYDREESRSGSAPRTRFENTTAQEVLTLRNPAIHVYDPRLLTLSVEGSFGLFHERLTEPDGKVGDFEQGTLFG